jgi:hypothetical protein
VMLLAVPQRHHAVSAAMLVDTVMLVAVPLLIRPLLAICCWRMHRAASVHETCSNDQTASYCVHEDEAYAHA